MAFTDPKDGLIYHYANNFTHEKHTRTHILTNIKFHTERAGKKCLLNVVTQIFRYSTRLSAGKFARITVHTQRGFRGVTIATKSDF